ncbi:hypothetical protein [Streptomyces sp. XD-27]|uniref:hypothetical protein n=1 Tax=Streptomyces sp. XD-27 TaxID=3062779 RepID=UPI0026F4303F|nr:hypothetical protein [Streptomyces sp. XD-27]WKX70797.1 hypothetical protein Q3Y56_13570 [Streptomyces sp. XD-27]
MSLRRRRPAATGMALGALALLLAGCGIRGTSVPVDAGAAPSRVSCETPAEDRSTHQAGAVPVTVFLVCASQLHTVQRSSRNADAYAADEPLRAARDLLEQLQEQPSAAEAEAGFDTQVREDLEVSGPAEGDPARTLRLSLPPADLPAAALAQVVCTFAGSAASGGQHEVLLSGPDREEPVQRYECSAHLRDHPEKAFVSGMPVG